MQQQRMNIITTSHFDVLSGVLHYFDRITLGNLSQTAALLIVISFIVFSSWQGDFLLQSEIFFFKSLGPLWNVLGVEKFFMQYKLELMEVFNNRKSAVIPGFIFLSRSFLCFCCHFSGCNSEDCNSLPGNLVAIWRFKAFTAHCSRMNLPAGSMMNPLANAGDTRDVSSIPGSGRSPEVGNGNSLQYFRLENPMDGGAWRGTVHGVTKSWAELSVWTHFLV